MGVILGTLLVKFDKVNTGASHYLASALLYRSYTTDALCVKYLFLVFITISFRVQAQPALPPYQQLYEAYERYREPGITTRRFKHEDIASRLLQRKSKPQFTVTKLGESVEGRAIYDVAFGRGKTQVLLWSQMHGNEPTATMAGLDLFNFIEGDNALTDIRQTILDSLTVHFIPMLNPDGAEVYQRRNALNIDLNRDAQDLKSPESRLLKALRDSVDADFGFNLHDQSIYYAAGPTDKPATISFLAPPFNYQKDTSAVRNRATRLIVLLNRALQHYIPGQVGRYNDTFEPRAFGDNMQRWGTSTVLIESGGYANDPEKQHIRRLNFMLLTTGLHAIATRCYTSESLADYPVIPRNKRHLFDLIIRNVQFEQDEEMRTADIGIYRDEVPFNEHRNFFYDGRIQTLGDLSGYYGYRELDATGLVAVPGRVHRRARRSVRALQRLNVKRLLKRGYTTVRVKKLSSLDTLRKIVDLDLVPQDAAPYYGLLLGNRPNFILEDHGKPKYAVVNGVLHEL